MPAGSTLLGFKSQRPRPAHGCTCNDITYSLYAIGNRGPRRVDGGLIRSTVPQQHASTIPRDHDRSPSPCHRATVVLVVCDQLTLD